MITAVFNGNYSLPVRAAGESTSGNMNGSTSSFAIQEQNASNAMPYNNSAGETQTQQFSTNARTTRQIQLAQSALPAFTAIPGRLNKEQVNKFRDILATAAFPSERAKRQKENATLSDIEGDTRKNEEELEKTLSVTGKDLSEEEQQQVERLKKSDREVRAHEAAHEAAGGSLVRGKSFSFTKGPDGKRYVTAGEVRIDNSPVPGDPEATARKMQQVRRAALAPSNPSAQDLKVASEASRTESQARAEAMRQAMEETQQKADKDTEPTEIDETTNTEGSQTADTSFTTTTNSTLESSQQDITETAQVSTPSSTRNVFSRSESPFAPLSSRRSPSLTYIIANNFSLQPRKTGTSFSAVY